MVGQGAGPGRRPAADRGRGEADAERSGQPLCRVPLPHRQRQGSVPAHDPIRDLLPGSLRGQGQPPLDFDEDFFVPWEPGLADGPTSSRFAVVDYNADTGHLEPPAVWDEAAQTFVTRDGKAAGPDRREQPSSFTRSACGRSCSARWRSSRIPPALGRLDSVGVRGQPADRRATRRLRRERLLRPRAASRCSSTTSARTTTPSTRASPSTSSITSSGTPFSTASGRSSTKAASADRRLSMSSWAI